MAIGTVAKRKPVSEFAAISKRHSLVLRNERSCV